MEGFKPCIVASRVFRTARPCRSLGRRRNVRAHHASAPPSVPPGASSPQDLDTQADVQALQQEQAVFERNITQNDALFRLQMAMGWSTFVIAPAGFVAVIVYPPALAVVVPLLSAAIWNWRRMLARGGPERSVITKRRREED